jgi:cytochrome c oxidase assembly protein Cox11
MRNDIDTYDEGEKDVYFYDDEKLPLSVRERRQTAQVYDMFKEKAQWGEFYRVYGIVLFLLGGFFLTIPFYNVICQTFGFTMSQHAKEYKFKDE